MAAEASIAGSRFTPGMLGLLFGAIGLGTALRFAGLDEQLLLSDEWHGLHAAALLGYRDLFTLVTHGATSIPLNLYDKLLLDTVGWSEGWLRAPSLVAGVALLAIFPWVARRVLTPRAALIGCFLLAVSPFLVFYSRYARPYSLVVLLNFLALMSADAWADRGRWRDAAVFVICGVLAAFLHLVEVRSLALLLVALVALKVLDQPPGVPPKAQVVTPGFGSLFAVGAGAGVLLLALVGPGILATGGQLFSIVGYATLTLDSLVGVLEFLCGTHSRVAWVVLTGLAAAGALGIFGRHRRFGIIASVVVVGDFLSVWWTRPVFSGVSIVLARYLIPILPLFVMGVAHAVDRLLANAEGIGRSARLVTIGIAGVAGTALIATGPLPALVAGVNGFTNHKAFQVRYDGAGDAGLQYGRYRAIFTGAGNPLSVGSSFYGQLAGEDDVASVIEYPMPVGDVNIPYAVYQAVHGKRVLGGYRGGRVPRGADARPGVVMAHWPVEAVLGNVKEPERIRLRNFVDIEDPEAVRRSGARYLIFHPRLEREITGQKGPQDSALAEIPHGFERYGEPVFRDGWLVVVDVGS